MGNQNIALEIVGLIGGKENLKSIQNCYTRVRMTVADIKKCNQGALEKLEEVMGVVTEGNSIQLVVGPGKSARIANAISGY